MSAHEETTSSDDELGPPRRYTPDIWSDTGFGPALGGLIVAFLGTWGGSSFFLVGYGPYDSGAYRIVAGLAPILMGVAGIALGWLTLRRRDNGLARAIAAAAVVVGLLTVLTGVLGWWGQELARSQQASNASAVLELD